MLISVTGQSIRVPCGETLVSNSVGIYECAFSFSEDWDGYDKTAVFMGENGEPYNRPIIDGVVEVPHEVLKDYGLLTIGVLGTLGEKVKPTIWGETLRVRIGTPDGVTSQSPSQSVYAAILEALNDKVSKGQGIENAGKYLKVGADGNVYPASGSTGGGAVDSVNGQTGDVMLTAEDVGALPEDTAIPNVPAWAMQAQKPTYTAAEVGALPDTTEIPDVPEWAMQDSKPTYTAQEVGALPASTQIPSALSELSGDATHRTVTDAEKATWSGKQDAISDLSTIREGAEAGATAVQPEDLPAPYTLPVAGANLGGVKNGGNVTVNADGTMNAPSGGGGGETTEKKWKLFDTVTVEGNDTALIAWGYQNGSGDATNLLLKEKAKEIYVFLSSSVSFALYVNSASGGSQTSNYTAKDVYAKLLSDSGLKDFRTKFVAAFDSGQNPHFSGGSSTTSTPANQHDYIAYVAISGTFPDGMTAELYVR